MERGKTTDFILKQFRKKSKRLVNKDLFTEFFYLNRKRRVIEFLDNDGTFVMETFFKEFLPHEFRDFVSIRIVNDVEEDINNWYYDEENVAIIVTVNWGFKKQEYSVEIDIENFVVTVIDEEQNLMKKVDYVLFNDYLISFLTLNARNIAQTYDVLVQKNSN